MLVLQEPLFMKPVFHEKLWGGTFLKDKFHYDIPSDHTGECWAISGHSHGVTHVANGKFKGLSLDYLWKNNPELFGDFDITQPFPLLVKILDANKDLSVQVHPNDEYALEHEHDLGKTECWYILDAKEDAYLYYGHNADTKDELRKMITNKDWKKLLRKVPVKKGDFVYVPSGTVHALGTGIAALETQQSSDSTYRIYDFDRVDMVTHKKRELHLSQAMDTITVPHVDPIINIKTKILHGAEIVQYVASPYFKVQKWSIKGKYSFEHDDRSFLLCSVINGNGNIKFEDQTINIKKGDHFIIPANFYCAEFSSHDELDMIVSQPGSKVKKKSK